MTAAVIDLAAYRDGRRRRALGVLDDRRGTAVLDSGVRVPVLSRGTSYVGLCPFHEEQTPSFSVRADKGTYYCFGCGRSGSGVRLELA